MTEKQLILKEKTAEGVIRIVLNNPPLNIVTRELTCHLDQVLTEIEQDSSVRSVILSGSGERSFSAGSDIKEFPEILETVVEEKLDYENRVFGKIANLSKPTIAEIEGVALGGGCEIALACDLRIMSENARIGLPEVNLGWFPGSGGLYRLPYIVGPAIAKELMFVGNLITAQEAFRIGLVNRVAESNQLKAVTEELANTLAAKPQKAINAIKYGVNQCFNFTNEQMLQLNLQLCREVFRTEDAVEGIEAFIGKRTPKFQHR